MTAVLDATPNAASDDSSRVDSPASWGSRVGAFTLDVLLGVGVIAVLAPLAFLAITVSQPGWLWLVYTCSAAAIFLLMAVNRLLLPAITGWSLGRALFGIRVVRRDGATVGAWRLLARDLAHLLDTAALFIGWLWPLWDSRRRTFADLLLRTEVRRVDRPEHNIRRLAAKVLAAAVVVCAAAVALNFVVVYRQERATDESRQQIAEQGPRIVEKMLSYHNDTLKDDFARAQGLATDGYRSQLVAQQDAVQKANPTSNEYWAVSSAVLSAAPTQASMLLAMQGQRGDDPSNLRFITATVRVDFEKSGEGLAGSQPDRAEEADLAGGPTMSPRRKIEAEELDFFSPPAPKPPRRWGLPIIATLSALLVAAAIAASTVMLASHETDRRTLARDADVLTYVRSFMTTYTTLDPFQANYYGDRIQSQATGDFAKMFKEKINVILVQVARAEPTQGTVLDAGIQRWNDDGSAEVLVATKVSNQTPDGKTVESGSRWAVTAKKEGQLWKISQLIQVI